jgi:pimeloyl-ACP methyl ester carboxylesterase
MARFVPGMFASTLVRGTATETMIRAYTAPFKDRASCIGAIAFPRDIPVGDGHPSAATMRSIQKKLGLLGDKAKIIVWGMQDPIFARTTLDWWKRVYPEAESHELSEAGHFLQEDEPEEIVAIITDFLRKHP